MAEVQSWAQSFCPKILASASANTKLPTASHTANYAVSSVAQSLSHPTSSPAQKSRPSSTALASPTSTLIDLHQWGADFPGTNWQTVTTSSKENRGPAVEGASIAFFVLACLIVGFRWVLYSRGMLCAEYHQVICTQKNAANAAGCARSRLGRILRMPFAGM